MGQHKCQFSACERQATSYFARMEGRRVIEASDLCDIHGHLRMEQHQSLSRLGFGTLTNTGNGAAFDIDLVFWDSLQNPPRGLCQVELAETGGHRHLRFATDFFALSALLSELHHYQSARPYTHQAMATLIRALGGSLQYVEIDKFRRGQDSANDIYEAKLHIRREDREGVLVDVRPADALIMAVVFDVPISVSNDVLGAM